MKWLSALFFWVFISCGATDGNQDHIKVACAANMQYAMDSIAIIFEADQGIQCDVTYGSSGMLTSQIESGAPYDVFISANMTYPERLFDAGKGDKPLIYGQGRLVFVFEKDQAFTTLDEALKAEQVERIGIADNRMAPYGMAADQYLNNTGQINVVKNKLVIAESINQVNQYVSTGAVDAGFTSYSFCVKKEEAYNFIEVDTSLFDPINQGVMLLEHGRTNTKNHSEAFINYLSTEKCKAVLNYFGYLTH